VIVFRKENKIFAGLCVDAPYFYKIYSADSSYRW